MDRTLHRGGGLLLAVWVTFVADRAALAEPTVGVVNADDFYDHAGDNTVHACRAEGNHDGCVNAKVGCAWNVATKTCGLCADLGKSACLDGQNAGCVWESASGRCVNHEAAMIHAACGAKATTCFPTIVADVAAANPLRNWMPKEVDSAGTYTNEDRGYVALYNQQVGLVADGLLLLFLPGCGEPPDAYVHLFLRAAANGYHVASVSYWNHCNEIWDKTGQGAFNVHGASAQNCQQVKNNIEHYEPDAGAPFWGDINVTGPEPSADACMSLLERFKVAGAASDGQALATSYHFSPPAGYVGIAHRVLAWLKFLDAKYPTQKWGQFYSGSSVLWNKVTVAGHSQGSGLVPEVVREHPDAYRGIMISGPPSYLFNWKDNTHELNPSGPNGVYTAPAYIVKVAPQSPNLWGFCGGHDRLCRSSGAGLTSVLADFQSGGMNLASGVSPGPQVVQDEFGFIVTDCAGPCTPPTVTLLQGTGAHKLLASQGTHQSVAGPIGEKRPFPNKDAWDYLLIGKGSKGANCLNDNWCTSTKCTANHTCK
jgi:hypothetical protein